MVNKNGSSILNSTLPSHSSGEASSCNANNHDENPGDIKKYSIFRSNCVTRRAENEPSLGFLYLLFSLANLDDEFLTSFPVERYQSNKSSNAEYNKYEYEYCILKSVIVRVLELGETKQEH